MITYQTYLPIGKESTAIEQPNCCLDPHPQLVFLGRGSWMLECMHCASNLVAVEVTEPVVGGQPEDLESPHVASGHYIEDESAYEETTPDNHWEAERAD